MKFEGRCMPPIFAFFVDVEIRWQSLHIKLIKVLIKNALVGSCKHNAKGQNSFNENESGTRIPTQLMT